MKHGGGEQHNENNQINVSDDIDKFELANSSKKTKDMEVQLYAYDRVASNEWQGFPLGGKIKQNL